MSDDLAKLKILGKDTEISKAIRLCLKKDNLRLIDKNDSQADYQLLVEEFQLKNIDIFRKELQELAKDKIKTCIVIYIDELSSTAVDEILRILNPYLADAKLNIRVIITTSVYDGAGVILSKFEERISKAVFENKIKVSGGENSRHFPTSISDLSNLILKSLFITNTAGNIYWGLSESLTDLELAYLLRNRLLKRDKNLDINIQKDNQTELTNFQELAIETQAKLNWIPKHNFNEDVDDVIAKSNTPVLTEMLSQYIQSEEKISLVDIPLQKLERDNIKKQFHFRIPLKLPLRFKTKTKDLKELDSESVHKKEVGVIKRVFSVILTTITLIISGTIVTCFLSIYSSTKLTLRSFELLKIGNSQASRSAIKQASTFQMIGNSSFQSLIGVGNIVAKEEISEINDYLLLLENAQSLISTTIDTYDLADQIYKTLIGKGDSDIRLATSALRVNLVVISEALSQIQLSLPKIDIPFIADEEISYTEINQQINLVKSQISLSIPLLDILQGVGTDQKLQQYLIIIQDSNELRPTGGFISTYGLITLDQGKIIDFSIDSSLSIDRLIEGKIDPPAIIKQLLGKNNWSFHDSNLDPDFSLSARQISWFYQRFKNTNLDGVIALNSSYLVDLLEQVGPQLLPDGQNIDQDNLVSLSSNTTASRGLDVITALSQVLFKKITANEIPFSAIARATLKSISFNELYLWFTDSKREILARDANIGGYVSSLPCHPQLAAINCQNDTFYLNESNMSINKLNYYQKRNQTITAQVLDTGEVYYDLEYTYHYPVPVPNSITTPYKAYYQLYIPFGAQSLTIILDNREIDQSSLVYSNIGKFEKIDFSASLIANQNHTLKIKFRSPHTLDTKKALFPFSFSLLKQPGTINDSQVIRVMYPEKFQPKSMTVPMKQLSAQQLNLQTSKVSEQNIGIIFKNEQL